MRERIAHEASSHSLSSFLVGSSEGNLGRITVVVATEDPVKSLVSAEYIFEKVDSVRAHSQWPEELLVLPVEIRRKARAGGGEASGSTHPQACLATRLKAWNECSNTIEHE